MVQSDGRVCRLIINLLDIEKIYRIVMNQSEYSETYGPVY